MSTATRRSFSPGKSGRQAYLSLGISSYTLLRWVAAGRIKPVLLPGESPRYPESEIERLRAELAAERAAASV